MRGLCFISARAIRVNIVRGVLLLLDVAIKLFVIESNIHILLNIE